MKNRKGRIIPLVIVITLMLVPYGTVGAQGQGIRTMGEVSAVSPGEGFNLIAAGEAYSILVDTNTRFISFDGSLNSLEDLHPGLQVYVMVLYQPDNTLLATHIGRADQAVGQTMPEAVRVSGQTVSVGVISSVFTVYASTRKTYRFAVVEGTVFHSPDESIRGVTDLSQGISVVVAAVKEGDDWTAQHVAVANLSGADPDELLAVEIKCPGIIVSSSGSMLTLQTGSEEQRVFRVNSATLVRSKDGAVLSLSQLQAGMGVVVGTEGDLAVWIAVSENQTCREIPQNALDSGTFLQVETMDLTRGDALLEAEPAELIPDPGLYAAAARESERTAPLEVMEPVTAVQPDHTAAWTDALQGEYREFLEQAREIWARPGR